MVAVGAVVGLDTEQSVLEIVSAHPSLQRAPRRLVRTPSEILEATAKRKAAHDPVELPLAKMRRLTGKGPPVRDRTIAPTDAQTLLGWEMRTSVQTVRSVLKDTVYLAQYDDKESLFVIHPALPKMVVGYH